MEIDNELRQRLINLNQGNVIDSLDSEESKGY